MGVTVGAAVGVITAVADGDGTGVGDGLAVADALALADGVTAALADGAPAVTSGSRSPFTKPANATPATRAVTATAAAATARSGELVIQDHAMPSRFKKVYLLRKGNCGQPRERHHGRAAAGGCCG